MIDQIERISRELNDYANTTKNLDIRILASDAGQAAKNARRANVIGDSVTVEKMLWVAQDAYEAAQRA